MKTLDELWEECNIADDAVAACQTRHRAAVLKDPEYVRTLAACDAAYEAWDKARAAERENTA